MRVNAAMSVSSGIAQRARGAYRHAAMLLNSNSGKSATVDGGRGGASKRASAAGSASSRPGGGHRESSGRSHESYPSQPGRGGGSPLSAGLVDQEPRHPLAVVGARGRG